MLQVSLSEQTLPQEQEPQSQQQPLQEQIQIQVCLCLGRAEGSHFSEKHHVKFAAGTLGFSFPSRFPHTLLTALPH